ncbi:MAG: SUMF1/EgtB/PvdO family nonheme iron enzyme [Anaerolineales bacterium]
MKYYEILDVSPDATPEQIRSAYRILVQLHHPDRLQQANSSVRQYAEERLKKINEAYTVLSDPARRAKYDVATAARSRHPEYEAPAESGAYPRRSYRPRRPATERAAYEAAYEEWAHQQAERYAEAREAEYARRAAQRAERERRAADERARRAAEEQFPRVRLQGDELILYFAPGLWTPLVRVPAGEFLMGSDPGRDPAAAAGEQPQHRVYLSEFFASKYPITNAQYQTFVEATGRELALPLPAGKETHPVVNVSWDDAVAFCQWLNKITGRAFRLPTEAEWEKAARGEAGRLYPWGDEWDPARLNSSGEHGETTSVGQFSPGGDSPYGLADVSGNAWEWCADWYADKIYPHPGRGLARDPQGPADGEGCVVRGGAFDSSARHCRCANRNWFYPFNVRKNVGFRIVVAGPV